MSGERVYFQSKNYLLEIDYPYHNGNRDTIYETWYWEVCVVNREDEYKVMAIERNKERRVPWTILKEESLHEEILKLCREKMIE